MPSTRNLTLSPESTGIHHIKDTGIAKYIEFPEDVFFMESLAQNSNYEAGVAYVPVKRFVDGVEETHIYTITADSTDAQHFCGPIKINGSKDITVFGSDLSSTGILYLCAYNRNSILLIDCKTQSSDSILEITGLPSPNDVCIDPNDESILYVAGGTMRHVLWAKFSNPARGVCYKVEFDKCHMLNEASTLKPKVSVFMSGLKALAGIQKMNDDLFLTELFRMREINAKGPKKRGMDSVKKSVVWRGEDPEGQTWLADNVDRFDDDWVLSPAYSSQSERIVDLTLKNTLLSSTGICFAQFATACVRREVWHKGLQNPEVLLSFSNTYIKDNVAPDPVRVIFLRGQEAFHFEVDLVETRALNKPREIKGRDGTVLGKRHFFNGSVTHAAQLFDNQNNGFIACVNFEEPRILLLDDKPFRKVMKIRPNPVSDGHVDHPMPSQTMACTDMGGCMPMGRENPVKITTVPSSGAMQSVAVFCITFVAVMEALGIVMAC